MQLAIARVQGVTFQTKQNHTMCLLGSKLGQIVPEQNSSGDGITQCDTDGLKRAVPEYSIQESAHAVQIWHCQGRPTYKHPSVMFKS